MQMRESEVLRSSLGYDLSEVWLVHLGNFSEGFGPQRVTAERRQSKKTTHSCGHHHRRIDDGTDGHNCSPSTACRVAAHMAQKTTLPDVMGI